MNFRFCSVALAVLVTSTHCLGQENFHITFDGAPSVRPGSGIVVTNYYESILVFTAVPGGYGFTRLGANDGSGFPRSAFPDDGSAFLDASIGDSLSFTSFNGSAFNLVSVDLAEYSTVLPDAITVHFVGYRKNGSIITSDFTPDGIIDGTGPLADFETFHFGPEWTGLARVEIPNAIWSLDNLVVSIPEPSDRGLLLLGGGLALGFVWRRRE